MSATHRRSTISDFENAEINAVECPCPHCLSLLQTIPTSEAKCCLKHSCVVMQGTRRHPRPSGSAKGPAHQLITQVIDYIRHTSAKQWLSGLNEVLDGADGNDCTRVNPICFAVPKTTLSEQTDRRNFELVESITCDPRRRGGWATSSMGGFAASLFNVPERARNNLRLARHPHNPERCR
jgi:hypothetical protein